MEMRVFRLVWILALILGSGTASAAQSSVVPFEAKVVEEGVYEAIGGRVDSDAPNAAAGKASEIDDISLVAKTNVLEAALGVGFGFRYTLYGVPNGNIEGLEMRAIHPPMKGPDGVEREVSTAPKGTYGSSGQAEGFVSYFLIEPFEVLTGRWRIQLLYKGTVIISREFVLQ